MIFLDAGVVQIDGTAIVELIAFLIMLAILARWIYPEVVRRAEARQGEVAEQLKDAANARSDAEAALKDATEKLAEARKTAQSVIDGATRSAEQLRMELKQKAEEEGRRVTEAARNEIEAERSKAVESVRGEVAGMVVAATAKVIGETLDAEKHKQLIERAISEVASGDGRS